MEVVRFKLIVPLFFSAFLLLVPTIHATDFDYCDKKAKYPVKVKGVSMSPDPVVRSKPETFSISASTDKVISEGKLVIDVSYFGFNVHSETHKICAKTTCPISVGDFVISHSQTLPGYTPPGSYTLKMRMQDESGKQLLTCINFGFSIWFLADVADS